jgi:hypothetical protein
VVRLEHDTLTRAEYLAARGNGTLHAPAPSEPSPRTCAGCGKPLNERQKQFCGRRCSATAVGGRARAAAAETNTRKVAERRASANGSAGGNPSADHEPDVSPAGVNGALGELLALMDELPAEVVGVELVGDWVLRRR